jgi:L-proline amide hydrolase
MPVLFCFFILFSLSIFVTKVFADITTFIPTSEKNKYLFSKYNLGFSKEKYLFKSSFQDGTIEVSREFHVSSNFSTKSQEQQTSIHVLHYRIHNRMNLSSQKAAPILVLHGGPGVPSDYLYPLTEVIPYRSIVFYDQLGSGRSPGPEHIDAYSIEKSLDDLELLIKKLNIRRFHLYGQSFGGILAFEYLKRVAEKKNSGDDQPECLSVILSSTPSNVEQVEASANILMDNLLVEDDDMSSLPERFRLQNQCRIPEKPQSLVDAYSHAGTVWRGTDVIKDWKAKGPADGASRMPSALVMRGEHDFVSDECVQGWKKVFNHPFVRIKVLDGCSHHGLLENGREYGDIVDSYCSEYD